MPAEKHSKNINPKLEHLTLSELQAELKARKAKADGTAHERKLHPLNPQLEHLTLNQLRDELRARQAAARARAARHENGISPALEDLTLNELQIFSRREGWRQVFSTFLILLSAILIALFVKAYLIQPYIVDGLSMQPTLQNSDRLIVDKLPRTIAKLDNHPYVPNRGDIIVFNQSGLPGYTGTKQLIKRVIGLPGEHLVISNGSIIIYNSAHPGGFNPDTSSGYSISQATSGNIDITLGPNQIFVCGDNRSNSEDSRYFGPVSLNNIVGKLSLRILPVSQFKHF